MEQKTIAVLTIGQTPRADITDDLKAFLPHTVRLQEYGALDGLTRGQAQTHFGYEGRGELLITRMGVNRDMISLSGEKIMAQMQVCIDKAQREGARVLLMGCTGLFPDYRHSVPLLLPGRCQREHTLMLAGTAPVGVVIPNLDQKEQITQWWREVGNPQLLMAVADPFGDTDTVVRAAQELKTAGANVLCLDCFGYTAAQQAAVIRETGLETVLPRAVVCQMARVLLENP